MRTFVAALALVAAAACSHAPSQQLIDALSAYDAAMQGPAGKQAPADLYEARKVLDRASAEYAENGNTPESRDWAYMAQRRVELANTKARILQERQTLVALDQQVAQLKDWRITTTRRDLEQTRRQLEEQQRATEAAAQQLAERQRLLELEREARTAAEDKLGKAMKDLETIAAVKEEQRGTVITLSGSVLFAPGQSVLLSTAQTRLDEVADALKEGADGQRITVEGHTDSVGAAVYNEQLSMMRATAVRDYLVSRGVPATNISARGWGETRPVTDNSTAEGRANNRRVEIVIAPTPVS